MIQEDQDRGEAAKAIQPQGARWGRKNLFGTGFHRRFPTRQGLRLVQITIDCRLVDNPFGR
jgi:hypothetical protein